VRIALVLGVVGQMLARFAPAAVAPLVLAAIDGVGREVVGFAAGALAFAGAGLLLARGREPGVRLMRAEVMAVVALTWLLVGLVGGVPFLFVGLSPVDAAFESVSGITTTGASVLTDFSLYGRGVYLWRSVLHWVGGLGVIALFVAILPQLGIAGRQLFFAEASTASGEGIAPQVRRLSGRLWLVYALLTGAETLVLLLQGMPAFDSVCNAMATMSAGGFSPNGASIAGYGLPACEWTIAVFMFLAGANFALQWRALAGRPAAIARDPEFRVYAIAAALGTFAVAVVLAGGLPGEGEWRLAFFQVASVMSATGFASADFNLWADGARALLVALMLFGGCAGSAAGGPKVVRYMLVAKHCRREMVRTVHPQAVVPVRLGRAAVSEDVIRAVVTFVVVYLATWFLIALVLTLLGLDIVSALSGTLACLANCGPGLNALGPMANYAGLPAASKWILVLTMWVGRLEVVTVVALLRTDVLRRVRWR
jgi:trk system potassium uptake protein TrkH